MYGVGYPVLENAIHGQYAVALLLVYLIGKIAATSLTMAIGGSGGVFAPALFMGAMLGSAFGTGAHDLLPAATAGAGAYGLVAMGAVFAATSRAPITAVVIVFELTGDYSIILPLMLAVVVATALSHLLSEDSIYTLKLRRRGIDIERPAGGAALHGIPISLAMQAAPIPLAAEALMPDAAARLADEGRVALPVVDADEIVVGVLDARAVERALERGEDGTAIALAEDVPELRPGDDLHRAIESITEGDREALPITYPDGGLAGWIEHRDLLRAYATRGQAPVEPESDKLTPQRGS
jgi:CIC family chloride channel protein